ncbi:MAG: glycosyltransferase family 4 protein [bacterium]
MRILLVIPGTGDFYCGACIRDTALVRALRRFGHEVIFQPLYLPLLTDEPDIEDHTSILFGGINVYLQQKSALFRKTPRCIDRFFDAHWLLDFSARRAAMTKSSELGEMTVSMLAGEEGRQAKELNRFAQWLQNQQRPDVVILSTGMLLGLAKVISRDLGFPLVCTLQGEDGFLDALPEPYQSEAWRLFTSSQEYVDAFIPVSYYYADVMKQRMNLHPDNCIVIQNGISLDGYGDPASRPETPTLGYLARMCPVKGLDTLIEAFLHLKKKPEFQSLKLKVAGTMTHADRPFVDEMKKRLAEAGVLSDASFLPNISRNEKIEFLKSLSVLSVPATYGEAFGLYVIESMAAGVPVVQPRHGGFSEIIDRTEGGVLYEADDMNEYISTLSELLSQPGKAHEMGMRGRDSVHDYFHVDRMAQETLQILERVRRSGQPRPSL